MKKYILLLALTLAIILPVSVYAQGTQSEQGLQEQDRIQDPTTHTGDAVGSQESQIQNQNQVNTQNQGEESQLQVATQYMEQLMDMEGLGVELGQEIKTVAQEQVKAQVQIQEQLNKLESKSGLMKILFGPDYGAIKNLKQQVEQNQLRIQQLTQLQNEVANQADKAQLQEAVQALADQNTALEEQINAEEQTVSLFGWLVKLFNQ